MHPSCPTLSQRQFAATFTSGHALLCNIWNGLNNSPFYTQILHCDIFPFLAGTLTLGAIAFCLNKSRPFWTRCSPLIPDRVAATIGALTKGVPYAPSSACNPAE